MTQHQQQQIMMNQQQQMPTDNNPQQLGNQQIPNDNSQQIQQSCIRTGCTNAAVQSNDWEDEYCSNECVITHCR